MSRRGRWLLAGAVLATLLLAALFALADAAELRDRARELRPLRVAAAAALALVSYACIGLYQRAVLRSLGHVVPALAAVRAGLVATVVSRTVRTGGLSGAALLAWVLRPFGVTASSVATAAVAHAVQTNALFALLVAGALSASLAGGGHERAPEIHAAFALLAAVLLASLGAFVGALSSAWVRARLALRAGQVAGALGRLLRKPAWRASVEESLQRALASTSAVVRGRASPDWRAGSASWAWAAARVAASAAAFTCCARAAGVEIGLPAVLLAYSGAKFAGTLSFVPAGLGAIELSLAGALAALGAPYEAAVLAALTNRATYHLVPLLVALPLGAPLMRGAALAPDAERGPGSASG